MFRNLLTTAARKAGEAVLQNVKGRFPGNGNTGGLSVIGTQIPSTNTRNLHTITITAKSTGGMFDMSGRYSIDESQLTKFENTLRGVLKENKWPSDDTELDIAIKQYINSPIFNKYNNGPTTEKFFIDDDDKNIFLFAVLSGMIQSIKFVNNVFNKDGTPVAITTADGYMTRYNATDRYSRPYFKFKEELHDIAKKIGNVIVTITTNFSKIPPPPPVKGGGTRVHRETRNRNRNRNRNHTRRIRTQRHRYRSVKLAKSRKSRR
jgi:ABC-type antimicrobial peptide transport system permease subunit